jgi:RHS repeat-associated protein
MKQKKHFRHVLVSWITVLLLSGPVFSQQWNANYSIGTQTGKYSFAYNQTPDQLVEIYPAAIPNTGLSYQWEQSSSPTTGFTAISGATQTSYSFSGALSQTTYFRKKATSSTLGSVYSNTIKISVVSVNWEDYNYIREHDVLTTGITGWQSVDQLTIGQKLQTTTYLDGLGRSVEKVSRETATPASGNLWGDVVQFSQYDVMGREPVKYLPYTTTNQSGKFKTTQQTDQPQYYTSTYSETSAYSSVTFDNSPLNRVMNVKEPGTAWAASAGKSANYDVNGTADSVQIFSVDYVQGDAPVNNGPYPANTLYKVTYTDEYGKQVVEYTDKSGKLILKKVQIDNAPATGHAGWICTYSVYDDFGLLRFQLQPEVVKYLNGNGWYFGGNSRYQALGGCFQYNYDDKGRVIWKEASGAAPLNMIYDIRDRVVFMQDGNQAALSTPQWTANLYDDLDRPVITTLYNTTEPIPALQADVNNAFTINNVSNPINANLNDPSVCTIVKYFFYDNYNFTNVKPFNGGFTNTSAYSPSDPNVLPLAPSQRTTSYPTGSMVRVLGTNTFLYSTEYYDEKGHPIQTLEDNVRSGTDITTSQYHFDGRVLSTCSIHYTPNTGYNGFITLTKYLFDKLGRVTSIQKQYGSNTMTTVASYDYDDIGRVKTKHLDPNYNNPNSGLPDLESLNYSFNIHNQITGINKDYAQKTAGSYNKWGHYFGMYLGFDNRDRVFTASRLNGQVAGQLWNTQGDDTQRKYDYSYDNADRLINAVYNEQQHPTDGWSHSKMDFSVSGSSGQITYDLNGNLLTMLQKGVVPGTATPLTVDDLHYTYASYINLLLSVTDQMTNTNLNGQFGDFKDGTNATGTSDYVYDANGNVVTDLNKNIQNLSGGSNGIRYNYLDKPEQINIVGKGVIQIVYDADGNKLQRIFTPTSGPAVTTTYINQFVYQSTAGAGGTDTLKYINFEEGRIRIMQPVSQGNGYDALVENGNLTMPNGRMGVWDYFVRDYQQNVRMILTEETHQSSSTATMETSRAGTEDAVFGQPGTGNEVEVTRYAKPPGWSGNTSGSVSRLGNIAGHNLGPNTLQKVMAGDQVSAVTQYYLQSSPTNNGTNNIVTNIISNLLLAIGTGNTTALVRENASGITNQLNRTPGFISAVKSTTGGSTPEAYLTILFFDERFNFIAAADGGVAQQQVAATVGSNGAQLVLANIKAPKNGYAYVYVNNQSDQDVYFDNLQVGVTAGNIIEEDHYYAYGLKIAGISSKKLGDSFEGLLKNNNLYNDKELFDDGDLDWYDYGFRNYDPQIGRFMQLDPLTDDFPFLTPYQYASNDPITNIDLDGLEGVSSFATAAEAQSAMAQFTSTVNEIGSIVVTTSPRVLKIADKGSSVVNVLKTLNTLRSVVVDLLKVLQAVDTKQVGNPNKFLSFQNKNHNEVAYYELGNLAGTRSDADIDTDGDISEVPRSQRIRDKYHINSVASGQKVNPYVYHYDVLPKETNYLKVLRVHKVKMRGVYALINIKTGNISYGTNEDTGPADQSTNGEFSVSQVLDSDLPVDQDGTGGADDNELVTIFFKDSQNHFYKDKGKPWYTGGRGKLPTPEQVRQLGDFLLKENKEAFNELQKYIIDNTKNVKDYD